MKQIIKLTENQLRQIVTESVKIILKENEQEKFVNSDYEQINYERAKDLHDNYGITIYVGDMEKNPMAVSHCDMDKTLGQTIRKHKNYYPNDDIKFYLYRTWAKCLPGF